MKDDTVSIHHINIQTLAIEMFEVKNEMSLIVLADFVKPMCMMLVS